MPVVALAGDACEQIQIHSFVNDSEEAQARMWNARLIVWVVVALSSAGEMRDVDAARKRMNVRMLFAFGFEKTLATSEHDRCPREELLLERRQRRWRARECRELVHTVEDDSGVGQ